MRGSDCLRHFGLLGWTRLFRECDHHQHALCQTVILLMNGYGKMPISVVILRSKFVTANFNSPNFYFSTAFVMVNSQKQNPLSMLRPVAPSPRCPVAHKHPCPTTLRHLAIRQPATHTRPRQLRPAILPGNMSDIPHPLHRIMALRIQIKIHAGQFDHTHTKL